jgi:hypothetical protein
VRFDRTRERAIADRDRRRDVVRRMRASDQRDSEQGERDSNQ